MRGSRNFGQGGGGGGGWRSRPDGQKTVWTMFFFSHQLILQFTEWIQWFYGFITEGRRGVQLLPGGGGVQRNPYNLWFSRGSGPPYPPLDLHVGSPDATVCLQNHGLSKFK